jgi:NTE family protein
MLEIDAILKQAPLFASLSQAQRSLIKERARLLEYRKGQIIYEEGSAPSAFYCVVLGRVAIYTKGLSGQKTPLEYLHRGKYFGIISLLTNEPHSVTAEAINDSLLLVIQKDDFGLILKEIPALAIDLSQTLCRRLKSKDIHQKTIFESTIISVFSSSSRSGKTIYALNLALSLSLQTQKSVIIIDIAPAGQAHSLAQKLKITQPCIFDAEKILGEKQQDFKTFVSESEFGIDLFCLHYRPDDESCVKKILAVLSHLVNDYHFLVLDLPSEMDRTIFELLNQSDMVHLLSSPQDVDLERTRHLRERLKKEFNFPQEKFKIIINEYKASKLAHEEQVGILAQEVFATLPRVDFGAEEKIVLQQPDCEYALAVRRISRQVGDCLVGLVLGVGVGYGFCHIGILKVIEEEKIPIDIISGSSIGAIIASLWACGRSSAEILEIIQAEFRAPKHLWNLVDFTIPRIGFIKGRKLHSFLKKHIGNRTFYDIRLPLKIIASDVKRKEPKIFDKGPLLDALMASCAMPGVFAPFRFKEEMLFDGGVINPLPTEPLFKMGVKKIIAVNVTPSRDDILRQYEKLKQDIVAVGDSAKKRHWFSLKENTKKLFRTNILDIIFSSVEILQSEVASKEGQLADIVLHPDTSGLYWLELHRAAEFCSRGEEEARRNLDKIRRLIRE